MSAERGAGCTALRFDVSFASLTALRQSASGWLDVWQRTLMLVNILDVIPDAESGNQYLAVLKVGLHCRQRPGCCSRYQRGGDVRAFGAFRGATREE